MTQFISSLTVLILSLLPMTLSAKIFRNAYVSFELPEKWDCKIEGTEWVCSSTFKKNSREAIIILTAKEAGPSDNLSAYTSHLKRSKLLPNKKGSPTRSKVLDVKSRRIANQNWVDGMHKGSEIASYYTRYLATVKDRVAILVTFSAHLEHYTKYSSDFFRAIQSLRVVASKALVNRRDLAPVTPNSEIFGVRTGDSPTAFADDFPEEASSPTGNNTTRILGGLLLALASGLYYYLKKKK